MLNEKFVSIYLNDHLAGSTVGVELARRTLSSNRGARYGEFLEWLVTQVQEDRQALIRLMEQLGVKRDPIKQAAAWSLEKAGRLKLNGRLLGYSPLSRLVELEGHGAPRGSTGPGRPTTSNSSPRGLRLRRAFFAIGSAWPVSAMPREKLAPRVSNQPTGGSSTSSRC